MGAFKSAAAVVVTMFGVCGAVAPAVGAFATVGPPPQPSAATGLPDGRVYEEVSPADKHGYEAGASARLLQSGGSSWVQVRLPGIASANGNAFAFTSFGPAADVNASGLSENFVAERTISGWRSRSSVARVLKLNEESGAFQTYIKWPDYSADLSHVVYEIFRGSVREAPLRSDANIYRMGPNPLEEPIWLLRAIASPALEEGPGGGSGVAILGMTPDTQTVYFADKYRLLPQDESRSGWGLYEARDDEVREVGVLPDGSVPSNGALPASAATSVNELNKEYEADPASFDNQVSRDGKRLFFFAEGQLYVHELGADGGERSVLVSASQVQGHIGEAAPDGVALFENRTKAVEQQSEFSQKVSAPTYAYASSDGSHVVFQSLDQLTSDAPSDSAMKVYDFDVDAGTLEYLPNVSLGGIVTAADDGSSFLFVNEGSELELWNTGEGGGSVRQIAQLPPAAFVGPGRMVAHDSTIVFQAEGPISGVKDSADEQIYRYEISSNTLTCVSCAPGATIRSGNAYLSATDQYTYRVVNDARGVSSDGSRIFFASPNALVSRDTNGDFDTYEWENGNIFLVSSGVGANYSPFLDNSESGGDVFFASSGELVEGDNDGGFDIYDARIPRPGDNPPPSAVPCSGDVCQGPPSVVQLLDAPASAAFSGAENIVDEGSVSTKVKLVSSSLRARRLAFALKACRRSRSVSKRKACERRARRRYAAKGAQVKHNRGGGE